MQDGRGGFKEKIKRASCYNPLSMIKFSLCIFYINDENFPPPSAASMGAKMTGGNRETKAALSLKTAIYGKILLFFICRVPGAPGEPLATFIVKRKEKKKLCNCVKRGLAAA